jgi:cytochrome c biogenesis protein CcmG/thiol:disulfide interchange protein DsbE
MTTVRTWVGQHRLATIITAACVVMVAVLSVVTSGGAAGNTPASDPRAPAFSMPMLSGPGKITLSQYTGKPLILNFWASWCADCQKETSLLVQLDHELSGRVSLIGVDESDTTTAALKYAQEHDMKYPLTTDGSYSVADAYGIDLGIPQTLFISPSHRIVDRILGAVTQAQFSAGLHDIGITRL